MFFNRDVVQIPCWWRSGWKRELSLIFILGGFLLELWEGKIVGFCYGESLLGVCWINFKCYVPSRTDHLVFINVYYILYSSTCSNTFINWFNFFSLCFVNYFTWLFIYFTTLPMLTEFDKADKSFLRHSSLNIDLYL